MTNVIEIENIHKRYADQTVLNGLSLNVKEHSVLGLIGENGAGKTTLIKSVLGLIYLNQGEIRINGVRINGNNQLLQEVGFLLEPRYHSYLSAYNNIKASLMLSGKYQKDSWRDIDNMLDFLRLREVRDKKVSRFSFGMKQRVGLAQALIKSPKILILDEPLVGLDPVGAVLFKEKVKELYKKKSCTILFSSHQLRELQEICTEIAVLKNGVITIHDKMENLIEEITAFTFANSITEMKEETYKCGKKVCLSDDRKTLFITNTVPDAFTMVTEGYAQYKLKNVALSHIGLEKYFGGADENFEI